IASLPLLQVGLELFSDAARRKFECDTDRFCLGSLGRCEITSRCLIGPVKLGGVVKWWRVKLLHGFQCSYCSCRPVGVTFQRGAQEILGGKKKVVSSNDLFCFGLT